MSNEVWKPVPGHKPYEVSSLGQIRNGETGRTLKSITTCHGYRKTKLGQGNLISIHRLVLLAFVGPCPKGCEASHKNHKRDDNRLANLCWETRSENLRRSVRDGRANSGWMPRRFTPQQVRRIRERSGSGESQRQIARDYGCNQTTIGHIVRGDSYGDVK